MDLGILNTVIALVIILLVLSLLVQAVQTLIKKLLKLKSHQIEDSLKDLYEQAIGSASPAPASTSGETGVRAGLRSMMGMKTTAIETPADLFKDKVLDQFKNIGRKTFLGRPVLDSLSKEDLFKVIGKLESEDFFPDYIAKFQALCDRIGDLRKAIDDITSNAALRGSASTKIAEIRSILAPIFNNVSAILDGATVKPKVLFADLLRLGKLDVHGLLKLVDEAQVAIAEQTKIAAADPGEVVALQTLSQELAEVAKLIGDLSQRFVDAISPLRNKLEDIETWFDTVTQSFDERYARHMKTGAIVISVVVVIVLNANFFHVYKSLSTNEVQRNLIVQSGPGLLEKSRQARAAASPTPAEGNVDLKADLQRSREEIETLSSTYQGFGFTPLSTLQVRQFLWSLGGWTVVASDSAGQRSPWGMMLVSNQPAAVWRAQTPREWWDSRKNNVVTLVGWAIMVMLLSVGAPFWQDTLESLFGIKNLLRQRTDTQNIETESGAGQPKS